ncbi:hypothetical protein Ahy_B10g103338 isoform A [Arachis hypogaea]|uniref:Uncharacterized protein n=1 Tax=Arachis hypogaea TaxID=3818 RepID=A0A444X3K3_ARAHY|nr:hypothetical protein Ahy_B10g103338 isoform A [Arachis hypogaea]
MAVYRQQVEESHHDLVNLLTQQMTTILNPMMADHESRFECLVRQVERITRIVDYDEGKRHNARGNNEVMENIFQNENQIPNRENPHVVPRGENADDYLAGLPIMDLGFYMRRKLLNVYTPDLAHLAEKVRQTELMKREKEKYRSEQRSKSKPFTRKEKVAYVTMKSSEEEFDFETEIDLAELKKALLIRSKTGRYLCVHGIVRNSRNVIIYIGVILSRGIEHLLEINMLIIEVVPGVFLEEEEEEKVSIRIKNFQLSQEKN